MERMHEARTWRRSLCRREKTWKLLAKGCEETFGFICLFVYFYHRWNFLMGKQVYGVGITPRWARERTGILTWTSLLHNLVLYLPVLWTTLPISKNSGDIPVFKGNPASEGHCLQSKHSWLEAKTKHTFPEDWSLRHFRSAWSLRQHPTLLSQTWRHTGQDPDICLLAQPCTPHVTDARLAPSSGISTDVTCLLMGIPTLHPTWPTAPISSLLQTALQTKAFSNFPPRGRKLNVHWKWPHPLGIPPPTPSTLSFHLYGLLGAQLRRDLLQGWHRGSGAHLSHFLL